MAFADFISGFSRVGNIASSIGQGLGLLDNALTGESAFNAPARETPTQPVNEPLETSLPAPQQAYVGALPALLPAAARGVGAAARLLTRPGAVGFGGGLVADDIVSAFSGPRRSPGRGITRKMQREAKQLVMMVGFDQAASFLGLNQQQLAMVLVKTFPRRGAGITASQLRTTQRTINKVVHMNAKLKAAYGSSTRRAPARRAAGGGTRITNVK